MGNTGIRWMMTRQGEPLIAAEFNPFPPKPDEVVVEIAGCGVCHTDLGYYYDGVRTKHDLPLTLGHEISGHVIAAGSEAVATTIMVCLRALCSSNLRTTAAIDEAF